MDKCVKDRLFLRHDGTWGQLAYYTVDAERLSNADMLNLLIEREWIHG